MKSRMKRLLSILLVLTMLFTLCTPVTASAAIRAGTFTMPGMAVDLHQENPFEDVNETHFFYESVLWAVGEGIISGTTNDGVTTTLSPLDHATRAQVAVMLHRFFFEQ